MKLAPTGSVGHPDVLAQFGDVDLDFAADGLGHLAIGKFYGKGEDDHPGAVLINLLVLERVSLGKWKRKNVTCSRRMSSPPSRSTVG